MFTIRILVEIILEPSRSFSQSARKNFFRHDNIPKTIVKVTMCGPIKRPLGRRSGENRFLSTIEHVLDDGVLVEEARHLFPIYIFLRLADPFTPTAPFLWRTNVAFVRLLTANCLVYDALRFSIMLHLYEHISLSFSISVTYLRNVDIYIFFFFFVTL